MGPLPLPQAPHTPPSPIGVHVPEASGELRPALHERRVHTTGPPEVPLRTAYSQQPWVVLSPEAAVTKGSPQG